jgi:hypothetical protein
MRTLRSVAFGLAGLFFLATLLRLADRLNLVASPADLPASANLVDRVLGSIAYRHDVWPLFFGANILLALGFVAIALLGWLLAARIGLGDDRRALLLGTFAVAGLLGAAGQLILVGSVKASIDVPYCDCGFKQEEVVSQVWALMVSQSASDWLLNGALLIGAGGFVIAASMFGGAEMPDAWAWLSLGIAAVALVALVLGFLDVAGDVPDWLIALASGILIPAWAIWLGRRFPAAGQAAAPTA